MVDGLKNEIIYFNGALILKAYLHQLESVGQALRTYTYGSVSHVGNLSLRYWVVVFINNSVKILGDPLSNIVKLFVVVLFSNWINKSS